MDKIPKAQRAMKRSILSKSIDLDKHWLKFKKLEEERGLGDVVLKETLTLNNPYHKWARLYVSIYTELTASWGSRFNLALKFGEIDYSMQYSSLNKYYILCSI